MTAVDGHIRDAAHIFISFLTANNGKTVRGQTAILFAFAADVHHQIVYSRNVSDEMYSPSGEGVQRRGVDLQGHLRGGHLHAEVQEGLVWYLVEKKKTAETLDFVKRGTSLAFGSKKNS